MDRTGRPGASGQAEEGGERGDPCVFVLECESMLVRQATGMTRPLKHRSLHSLESDLLYVCVDVCLVGIQVCFFYQYIYSTL